MDDAALERLMAEFVQGHATEASHATLLCELQARADLRAQLSAQVCLDRILAAHAAPALDPEIILRALPSRRESLSGSVMRRLAPAARWKIWARRPFLRAAAAIAILATVLFSIVLLRSDSGRHAAATLASLDGAGVLRREGMVLPLTAAQELFSGDTLVLGDGRATLAYRDGTVLKLDRDSQLQISTAAEPALLRPQLLRGALDAAVARQSPGRPLRIETPLASAEVLGTVFQLSAAPDSVLLQVREGRVRFTSLASGESRDVSAGEKGEVFSSGALQWHYTAPRDALAWPFSTLSPWNYPIGSGAQYSPAATPDFPLTRGAKTNMHLYSHPIVIAESNDPERPVFMRGSKLFSLRLPDTAKRDPSEKGTLHILDRNTRTAIETTELERLPDGTLRAVDVAVTDLCGPGFGGQSIRISGASCLGGLIRRNELRDGIPHALALSVISKALVQTNGPGTAFRWPATKSLPALGAGTRGTCQLGTLLALPPDVDLRALGVGESGPAFEVARALQDYGGYVVESFVDGKNDIDFFVEPGAADEVPAGFDAALSRIIPHLKIVANNSAQNIGGGGAPRRPLATELKVYEKQNDF